MSQRSKASIGDAIDPLHSKLHLTNFSLEAIRRSQMDTRQKQAQDQLFCELCLKIFPLDKFASHKYQHRRKAQPKIPLLSSLSNQQYRILTNQMNLSDKIAEQTIIDGLASKKYISQHQKNKYFDFYFTNKISSRQEQSLLSPSKPKLRFYANNFTLTQLQNEQRYSGNLQSKKFYSQKKMPVKFEVQQEYFEDASNFKKRDHFKQNSLLFKV